jgi:pantetheine-phosphate adenylyltransferase
MSFLYKQSVLGGTFDHLHLGHKKLIDTAFEQSEHVTIGLTNPAMYQNKLLADFIEDYSLREESLKNYLKEKDFLNRATIISIADIYGTTLQDNKIEAIFATEENLQNINLINSKRKEISFTELKVIIVSYVKDNNGENISSERIRKGEIDREGFVYKNIFSNKQTLILSAELRPHLQKPIGEVVKNTKDVISLLSKKTIVIAVGDIIASSLNQEGVVPAISIIDFRTRRHDIENIKHYQGEMVINEQGTINSEAVKVFQEKLDLYLKSGKKQTIAIAGEEDLLTLPAILLAPLCSIVLYGQFDMGVVVNQVDEELKKRIRGLLEKFE